MCYNDIPVLYCEDCFSLNIQNFINIEDSENIEFKEEQVCEGDYCCNCGSTNINICNINDYIKLKNKK